MAVIGAVPKRKCRHCIPRLLNVCFRIVSLIAYLSWTNDLHVLNSTRVKHKQALPFGSRRKRMADIVVSTTRFLIWVHTTARVSGSTGTPQQKAQ
ncbi:uncharacterized protein PITG_20568 [Phytophthora infestans T30-4]|uniref:Uncharacterized protein n=1 Tax=Phytophthora infestans (strain T30-4) TaxID=403677 RepID=D0P2H0_PHYIT|nr:uncharacterized protein PITG_20568 [Phytophthora infestans T30-4]EEY56263.1 hypothetical protein PITG_20568 [Phytophthora infestans T30-4]|eukprot:XP_002895513.1 hypothetical protein PITG_20568 [Phytophthora infestans T30-4]